MTDPVSNHKDMAAALAEAARTLDSTNSLDDTLTAIVTAASASVPGFEHVGIATIERRGRIHTQATTGEIVNQLDDLQYTLREGPCYDTLADANVVVAPDIQHDQRWPRYVGEASRTHGLLSQLAVKLYLDEEGTIGGLNLYSTSQREIDPDAESIAEVFASHAAIALGHAREVDQLKTAVESNRVISTAVGILMERYQLNRDRAFAFLSRASSHGNIKLHDIAQDLVEQAEKRSGGR